MDFQKLNLLLKCSKDFSHKKARECKMSETECLICSYVYYHEKCSQDDVVQGLHIDKTTLAKAMLTLESKGIIVRNRDTADKRKNVLELTVPGLEQCRGIISLHDDWLKEVMGALTAEEQRQFESYCEKLICAAEALLEKNGE